MNGGDTTNHNAGYEPILLVNGANYSALLKPDSPVTTEGVETIMKLFSEDCNTLVVEWTVDNAQGREDTAVVVGLSAWMDVRGTDTVSHNMERWAALPNNHGLYPKPSIPNVPFYIQAEEPFDGIKSSRVNNPNEFGFDSNVFNGSTALDVMIVHWNGKLSQGQTRVFRMMFSTNVLPCFNSTITDCSVCSYSKAVCNGKGHNCYFDSPSCLNSSIAAPCAPRIGSSRCSTCLSKRDCEAVADDCLWISESFECHSKAKVTRVLPALLFFCLFFYFIFFF